jgi:Protein of unknown function (DUF2637)
MTDRLIRITTALAVVAVAVVAAVISYQHAYELVRSHGEAGVMARLVPFTVDGLIWWRPWWCWTRVAGARQCRGWPRGPGRWDRGHGRRQPGARSGAWPGRGAGQRVARLGAGWLIRAADDADPHRAEHASRELRACTSIPGCITTGARSTRGTLGCANAGADRPHAKRSGSQPTRYRP